MTANDKPILVYATFASHAEAEAIGRALVTERLAACVNILPAITAIYEWQGTIHRDGECAMFIKSRASLADALVAEVRARHSYENCAVVVLPIEGGSPPFLAWVLEQTQPD